MPILCFAHVLLLIFYMKACHWVQASDVKESAEGRSPATTVAAQPGSSKSPSALAGLAVLKAATAQDACISAPSHASSTPGSQAPKKDDADASKPVLKAKKRQVSLALWWHVTGDGHLIARDSVMARALD